MIDGIRNTYEVESLRQFNYFFLISVQSDEGKRCDRLIKGGKISNDDEFSIIDSIDSEENLPYGQQVRRCNYMADIIILNNEEMAEKAKDKKDNYIKNKFDRYINLVQNILPGSEVTDLYPNPDETLMTIAYAQSRRSKCLKRKVGAVISKDSYILSAGFNNIPEGGDECVYDADINGCQRDRIIEDIGIKIKHCPYCGTKISINSNCPTCNKIIKEYRRLCPNCKKEIKMTYTCTECNTDIFASLLTGAGSAQSGKLLDVCRSLHAEENAILSLAKNGTKCPEGSVLYTTTYPCNLCANKIAEIGINKVVYSEPYLHKGTEKLFSKKKIQLIRFEGVKSTAYFRLFNS